MASSTERIMDASSLPPMPNRESGEPRPPRAPLDLSWGSPEERERDGGRKPASPRGQGPVLEWFRSTRRDAIYGGIFMFLFGVGFLTLRDWGLGWARVWWLWVLVVLFTLPVAIGLGRDRLAAGADWFSRTRSWVRTYELTSVRLVKAWGSDELELRDAHGGKVSVSLTNIQQKPRLWDLVYNGILHSVHSGRALTNQLARERLKLPAGSSAEAEPSGPTRSSRPMSKASRTVHVVLTIVAFVAGIFALTIALGFVVTGDALEGGSGIGAFVFLVLVGCGLFGASFWLKRRMER
ncbi:MAG: hypothetical protein GEV03_19270 [Streptosporangiales bacterium]|nr:hypothetical protein [Streptosporangiales bacterium]